MRTLTNSKTSPEERASVRSFKRHLLKVDDTIKQISVEAQAPNDPPDFWITISGTRYPVEVTQIMTSNELSYPSLCDYLLRDIRLKLSESANFKGTYLLTINGEPDFGKPHDKRYKNLVSKVVSTVISQRPNWEYRPRDYKGGYFLLSRIDEQGSDILREGPIRRVKSSDLPELLAKAISEKHRKLGQKGLANSSANPVLLLYDKVYADIPSYVDAFAEIKTTNGYTQYSW